MSIQTIDIRELRDVSPIIFKARIITFYDLKATGMFAKAIEQMVQGNYFFTGSKTQKIDFDEHRKIFDIGNNHFVLEYVDESEREKDIKIFQDRFIQDKKTTQSIPVEQGKQEYIPEYDGKFEYQGKFYVILHARHKLGTTDINKGIYKGVIVNTELYFSDKVGEQVHDGIQKTGEILTQEGN